ncbi:hypothetical protein BD626DRAFT_391849 [Schizophyllum amplum]|uniref:Uncharacterized protein n=1 Tax=Schizophyllum amplum TaxID=97359 RepID=A0A550CYJ8_9AGAR|nr:hypothetical protein BD626DRAFT_391849 [Auriculariopsis ampla]
MFYSSSSSSSCTSSLNKSPSPRLSLNIIPLPYYGLPLPSIPSIVPARSSLPLATAHTPTPAPPTPHCTPPIHTPALPAAPAATFTSPATSPPVLHWAGLLTTPEERLAGVRNWVNAAFPTIRPRHSALSRRLHPSPFRPHCAAQDRLTLWTSHHAEALQTRMDEYLPLMLQAQAVRQVIAGYEPGTREGYGSGLVNFHVMCDEVGIDEATRMPAPPVLLAAFVAQYTGTFTDSTVKNYLAGLEAWHHINQAEWHGNERLVRLAMRAVTKASVALKRPPRPPVLLAHLHALRDSLILESPRDAAVFALALAAFWGCRRLGELVPEAAKKYDPKRHLPRGANVVLTTFRGLEAMSFHLPWTKTTGAAGGTLILTQAPDDPLCPLAAFHNHTRRSPGIAGDQSFFAYIHSDGNARLLIKGDVVNAINALILGHSLRIGGSLEYLLEGVKIEFIMQLGGWTSTCFLIYWRRLYLIVPAGIITARVRAQVEDFERCHPIDTSDVFFS